MTNIRQFEEETGLSVSTDFSRAGNWYRECSGKSHNEIQQAIYSYNKVHGTTIYCENVVSKDTTMIHICEDRRYSL